MTSFLQLATESPSKETPPDEGITPDSFTQFPMSPNSDQVLYCISLNGNLCFFRKSLAKYQKILSVILVTIALLHHDITLCYAFALVSKAIPLSDLFFYELVDFLEWIPLFKTIFVFEKKTTMIMYIFHLILSRVRKSGGAPVEWPMKNWFWRSKPGRVPKMLWWESSYISMMSVLTPKVSVWISNMVTPDNYLASQNTTRISK